jgi:hypothetical protein
LYLTTFLEYKFLAQIVLNLINTYKLTYTKTFILFAKHTSLLSINTSNLIFNIDYPISLSLFKSSNLCISIPILQLTLQHLLSSSATRSHSYAHYTPSPSCSVPSLFLKLIFYVLAIALPSPF